MERSVVDRWLTWLILPASAALVLSALTLSRHAYTGVTVNGDRVATVEPSSPGALAGLRPGDHISLATPERRPSKLDSDPLRRAEPGLPLLLDRDRDGRHALAWLVPSPMPESERRYDAFLFAVASGFLLLGGWVWSERRDRLTRAFLVLCIAFAGLLTPEPRLDSHAWQQTYELAYTAATLFAAVVFAHFFALFPESTGQTRNRPWVRAGYGAATAIWLAMLAIVLEDNFGTGRWGAALDLLNAAGAALFVAGMLGGLVLFGTSFLRTRTGDARRRIRVAFFGTVLGAAPFVLVVAWRNLVPGTSLPFERLTVAFTLAVPASFAWAIAVHRVFEVRMALRAIVVLTLATLLAFATYAVGEWLAGAWWPALGAGVSGVSMAFLALVASLAGPARPWLSGLGARVVPIADEISLGAWAPSAEASRSGNGGAMLNEACEVVVRSLRLDGCAAGRTEAGEVRLVGFAGARLMPAPGPGFLEALGRHEGPRELSALDLAHEDHDTLELAGVHWVLPVPGSPPPAVLLLGRRLAGAWLDRGEVRDLERLGGHLAVALENAELRRQAGKRVALDRELEEAHHVQLHRLPRNTPVYPTLDCAAVTLSTESVGGDYYDFVQMGAREFTLAVGDAAGHGVPAALVLAGVQSRFRAEALRARHPGDLLGALNRDLVAMDQPEKFVGMLCARVDVSSGVLRFANAGLTPPLVRRADGRLEELRESGMLLGVSESAGYGVSSVELDEGDLAVVYTDGLTEASRDGAMLGVEGVQEVLDRHAHRRAADIVEELIFAVRRWANEPLDDLTVVVLKQLTHPAHRAKIGQATIKSQLVAADTRH
jgi:serine phosphatase RsbU (regulator of sigma subunit)